MVMYKIGVFIISFIFEKDSDQYVELIRCAPLRDNTLALICFKSSVAMKDFWPLV